MTTDRHACGLSSFLPMSCRGRAEAFARRLQSRLQSLGRQPSDDPNDSEESWLTTSQQAFPTSRQPRLSSSSESDIYFDFDCDFGSPESPQEEATESIHLNRRRECGCILEKQDLESGCATASATVTGTSPGSSDSSDNYYDPEAPLNDDLSALIDSTLQQSCSHVLCNGYEPTCLDCGTGTACYPQPEDKADCTLNGHLESQSNESQLSSSSPCGTEFETMPTNETLNTVGSPLGLDEVDNVGLGHYCKRVRKPRVDYTKCNGLKHGHSHRTTETHEENTKAHEADAVKIEAEAVKHKAEAVMQEEPVNYEAETVIHEAEAVLLVTDAKAHREEAETHEMEAKPSEAEIETVESETESHEAEANAHEEDTHEAEAESHEADSKAHEAKEEVNEEAENSTKRAEVAESPTGPVYRTVMTIHGGVEECCDDTFLSSLNILKRELLIECPGVVTSTVVPDVEITEATPVAVEATLPKAAKEEGASRRLEVDDDIEDDRPQRVRRCSSLKTGKTPPGTPGRKKIVRFADVLGLDLADVRTFLDEVPKVPNSAYEDLQDADLSLGSSSSIIAMTASIGCSLPKPDKMLVALFIQPGGCPDFLDRVREQQVCLENAVVNDAMLGTIAGTVRVRNLDFHKSVHVRYSVDDWKTFSDLQASYVRNSCDGFSDTFSFLLYAHHVTIGQRLEFAVRFQCNGSQYWDSNRGTNYAFQCLPPAGQSPFRSQPMSTCPDEPWASFY